MSFSDIEVPIRDDDRLTNFAFDIPTSPSCRSMERRRFGRRDDDAHCVVADQPALQSIGALHLGCIEAQNAWRTQSAQS